MNAINSYATSNSRRASSSGIMPHEERRSTGQHRSTLSAGQQYMARITGVSASSRSGRSVNNQYPTNSHRTQEVPVTREGSRGSSSSTRYSSSSSTQRSGSKPESSKMPKPSGRVWKSAVDPKTGRTYYYDAVTRETQWRKPVELASEDERRTMEKKEKKQKDFFSSMEQNILRNLQQGSFMPVAKLDDESRDSVGQLAGEDLLKQPVSGANPALAKPKSAVRTISQMDHTDILEMTRRTSGNLKNQENIEPSPMKLETPAHLVSTNNVMDIPIATEASWFDDSAPLEEEEGATWFDSCENLESSPLHHGSDFSISSDSSDEEAERAIEEIERAAEKMSLLHVEPPCPKTPKATSPTMSKDVAKPSLQKRNTCGTLYLSSTMSAPDKDATIKCVCGVFRAHLLQSVQAEKEDGRKKLSFAEYEIFNDVLSNSRNPYYHEENKQVPTLEEITNFYRDVFRKAQMETDCIIISLVYVERLVKDTNGGVRPHPRNWRSILFSSMILASKVWDDLSMWNADFSQCVSAREAGISFTTLRVNELERAMLSCLKYNVKVAASEYAKYYFLLRSMLIRSGLGSDDLTTLNPLDIEGAKQLELRSANVAVAAAASHSRTSPATPELGKPQNRRVKSLGHVDARKKLGADAVKEERSPTCVRASLEQIIPM